MIWAGGEILPDHGLTVAVLDRTFEHGLGLFETLRTWGGRPTLLELHKARMLESSRELGLPIDPASLPDAGAVRALLGAEGDRMLRITATGGTDSGRSIVWMRSKPLPPPNREGGALVLADPRTIGLAPADLTARHKTLNYWTRRVAHETGRARGYDETLIPAAPSGFCEASRSNLFVVASGALLTSPTDSPIVPGIMRRLVLDVAEVLSLQVREISVIGLDRLRYADEIFLTNAVRGIMPVARLDTPGGPIVRPAPGPWTSRLIEETSTRLWPDPGTQYH